MVEYNAFDQASGAVLLQPDEGKLYLVVYFSKKYIPVGRNYPDPESKLLAILKACIKWRCYLDGHPTTIYTDFKPLVSLSIQFHLSKWYAMCLEQINKLPLYIEYNPNTS